MEPCWRGRWAFRQRVPRLVEILRLHPFEVQLFLERVGGRRGLLGSRRPPGRGGVADTLAGLLERPYGRAAAPEDAERLNPLWGPFGARGEGDLLDRIGTDAYALAAAEGRLAVPVGDGATYMGTFGQGSSGL